MPPEPNPETFPALERPQGEERRAAFLQDAKKAPENPALSGTETELEEDAFYGVEELAAMSREGKGPELREEPDFFSSLARQEPDVALEAHDEADEPDAALSGAVRPRLTGHSSAPRPRSTRNSRRRSTGRSCAARPAPRPGTPGREKGSRKAL